MSDSQPGVDSRNASFWDELCGTGLARSLGITRADREGLRRFDEAYLRFYPYLWDYVSPDLRGRRVLEVGLGFGTLGHLIASRRAEYHAVDIAPGPVRAMRDRLGQLGRPSRALRASALALPYPGESFDEAFSIGCLHHTGNLPLAIGEIRRVLRPGGRAVVMVYNARSLRRLLEAPLRGLVGRSRAAGGASPAERGRFDANESGEAAPHTDFVSVGEARRMFAGFSSVSVRKRNCDDLAIRALRLTIPRARLEESVGHFLGLDLYVTAVR